MNEITNLQLYGHYYHKDSKALYKIIEFVKVRSDNDNKFHDGVKYIRVGIEGLSFVCTIRSFIDRFKNA